MELKERPLLDRVFIRQDEGESTIGGLAIPDTHKRKPSSGFVVGVGPGWTATNTGVFVPTTVKVGDHVVYNGNASTTVEIGGVDYICIREIEILIIL